MTTIWRSAASKYMGWLTALAAVLMSTTASASEADLAIPELGGNFLGMTGHNLLLFGLFICLGGIVFGLVQYMQIRNLPVHKSMLEISELIYETCKTYLLTQGKFLAILWVFIAVIIVVYFGSLLHMSGRQGARDRCLLDHRHPGQLSRWRGSASGSTPSPTPAPRSPASAASPSRPWRSRCKAGMTIGMLLISVELVIMLAILLFIPGEYGRPLLHRLRHRRIAGRRRASYRGRYLHEDRRHRLRPHEDRLQDQGRRRA